MVSIGCQANGDIEAYWAEPRPLDVPVTPRAFLAQDRSDHVRGRYSRDADGLVVV